LEVGSVDIVPMQGLDVVMAFGAKFHEFLQKCIAISFRQSAPAYEAFTWTHSRPLGAFVGAAIPSL
jgi:hypothetical protein